MYTSVLLFWFVFIYVLTYIYIYIYMMRYCTLYVYMTHENRRRRRQIDRRNRFQNTIIRTLDQTGNTPCTCTWKTWLVIHIHQTQI